MSEILVIGGGPAGAAASIGLARAGREVVLIEREHGPHDKVCGEFLSARAVESLKGLGLDPEALGARPVRQIVMSRRRRTAPAALPFAALSLSRRVMDEALLELAQISGVAVRRGLRAIAAQGERGDWRIRTEGGRDLAAREVMVATGKHNLRGAPRGRGGQPDLIGFKLHLDLTPEETAGLDGAVELYLFDGGYAGLQRVEGDLANLCLVVRKRRFTHCGGWEDLLGEILKENPGLAGRLSEAVPMAAKPLAISGIPYGYVAAGGDGLWRLGDQAAVIPSFAGEGMAIALQSGEMAAAWLVAGRGPDEFQTALARAVAAPVRGATILSQALVRPWSQAAAMAAAKAAPAAMRWIADATRTPIRANAGLMARSVPAP